jgi:hypothetical protein
MMCGATEYIEWRQRWPRVVIDCESDKAVSLLRDYYATGSDGRPRYSGSQFETIAARNADPNTIGPDEFVAVSLLSVRVGRHAALRLLSEDAVRDVAALLAKIPDADIVDPAVSGCSSEILMPDGPAGHLWQLLRSGKDGIGRTTTSKLMAAKRPRLIPIWDSYIERATGLSTDDYWRKFQTVLLADDKRIWNWLGQIRLGVADLPAHISTLRILDVVLWMLVDTDAV